MQKNLNKNLVAYCGLYCPKCYKMMVADSAEKLKLELINAKEKDAKFLNAFPNLAGELEDLIKLRCKKFCREGGGKLDCKIKICCRKKQIEGCWGCNDFKKRNNLKEQFVNNIAEIKKIGIDKYILVK